jgi:DNA-binding MarR family transcriptional regulator
MPPRAKSPRSSVAASGSAVHPDKGTGLPPAPRGTRTRRHALGATPDVREALDALRHIVQTLRVGRAGEHGPGLGSAQLFALQQIGEHPDASVNDIAALTFTHQSSVSVVIQRLVQEGLVAKIPASDDRRRQKLALTAEGRRVLDRAPVAVQEHLIAAIASLAPGERQALARSLQAIARGIAPGNGARHAPMFFEEHGDRKSRSVQRR